MERADVVLIFMAVAAIAVLIWVISRAGASSPPPPTPKPRASIEGWILREGRIDGRKFWFEAEVPDKSWRKMIGLAQSLVGEQFYEEAIKAFCGGYGRRVEIQRTPDNPHDGNAIEVIGYWRDEGGAERHGRLGHLPRELAAEIAASRPADMPIRAVPVSIYAGTKAPDIRVAIYEPSARSGYWKERGLVAPKLLDAEDP